MKLKGQRKKKFSVEKTRERNPPSHKGENLHIFPSTQIFFQRGWKIWNSGVKRKTKKTQQKMFFKNISKRKILLLIINALISILMISCVVFLYYYLPASSRTSFTVEKENSVHITKGLYDSANVESSISSANIRISSNRRSMDRSSEEGIDDTIYIDNDSYGDENYDNSGNFANQVGERPNEIPVTAPVTIIERPVDRHQADDDDFYYENYDDESETDDEDIVSSGDGKIVVNVKKSLTKVVPPPEPVNYIENVYSVSSEIVSNLKSEYNGEDTKQINKPDKSSSDSDSDKDESSDDEWQEASSKGKRLMGNNKSLVERSRQLLLCESARTGELCRMLFKGTAG